MIQILLIVKREGLDRFAPNPIVVGDPGPGDDQRPALQQGGGQGFF